MTKGYATGFAICVHCINVGFREYMYHYPKGRRCHFECHMVSTARNEGRRGIPNVNDLMRHVRSASVARAQLQDHRQRKSATL